jgi:chaperone modulatory protein CbpM
VGLEPAGWRFDLVALRRVRRMARLERDFDAVPELAALVADLESEIAALRRQLERLRQR